MEIKYKNAILVKSEFLQAIERLLQSRSMPAKVCIEINTAIDEIATQVNALRRARRDICLRFCKKNDKGEPVIINGSYDFPSQKDNDDCARALEELGNEYLTIQVSQPVIIYEDENITPLDLRFLGGLVVVKERSPSPSPVTKKVEGA